MLQRHGNGRRRRPGRRRPGSPGNRHPGRRQRWRRCWRKQQSALQQVQQQLHVRCVRVKKLPAVVSVDATGGVQDAEVVPLTRSAMCTVLGTDVARKAEADKPSAKVARSRLGLSGQLYRRPQVKCLLQSEQLEQRRDERQPPRLLTHQRREARAQGVKTRSEICCLGRQCRCSRRLRSLDSLGILTCQ
jgi:hypothetical protein